MKIDQISFDFDGVLASTNAGKANIFASALEIPAERRAAFDRRFLETGGTGRRRKLELLWREFHPQPASELQLGAAEAEIAMRTPGMVLATGLVTGIEVALRRLNSLGLLPSVVSGTPEAELHEYLLGLGVRDLFGPVRGSPVRKQEHLAALRSGTDRRGLRVYLGDTAEDAQAAQEAGWAFVLVGNGELSPPFESPDRLAYIPSPPQIASWLATLERV